MLSMFAHLDETLQGGYGLPDVNINWLAIIGATATAMIIGWLWYGPVFGKRWMKLVKLTNKDTEKTWQKPIAVTAVMALLQALIVKYFIIYVSYFYPEISNLTAGLLTGFWLFVGVALPLVLSSNMFARRPISLSYVEAGNQLVTLLAIGAILAVWT